MDKPILDACCGSKMFWFDKNNPNVALRAEIQALVNEKNEAWGYIEDSKENI